GGTRRAAATRRVPRGARSPGRSGRGPPRRRPGARGVPRGSPRPGRARLAARPGSGASAAGPGARGRARRLRRGSDRRESFRSWLVVQAEFPGDPVEGPGVLLAEGLRASADARGDRGPVVPFGPQLEDLLLLGREPAPDLLQDLARGHLAARA